MKITYRSSITTVIGVLLLILFGCKKEVIIPPLPQEESIRFEITPFVNDATYEFQSDSISLDISVTSAVPSAGINYSIKITRTDNSLVIFERETSSLLSSLQLKLGKFEINKTYSINIKAVSKSKVDNESSKTYSAKRKRVYKNYLKTSYELSNYENWLSSDDLYENGIKYTKWNPLVDQQHCQIDINGDGLEDIFYYDSYLLEEVYKYVPPSIYMNNGKILEKAVWTGPIISEPHASKVLVGDFNNDSLPDLFSCVAYDVIPWENGINQASHVIFNSNEGLKTVKEFPDQLGYWFSGCSGDIDKDGDLDVVMFNFHYTNNGVTNKILWNDGKGNFTYDDSGIGQIPVVEASELVDVNNDGFLDLVMDYVTIIPSRLPHMTVMWGNGRGFSLNNSTAFLLDGEKHLMDIDFADIDKDGLLEIIISGINLKPQIPEYYVDIFKSYDNGKSFIEKTSQFIENNLCPRFGHMIVRDLDNNGKIDIYAGDRKNNIRWEWNGSKFIRQ